MKLSISFKLLFSLSFLIFGMTASIAYFNSDYLKKTILQREKDFNLLLTESKAKEVNLFFEKHEKSVSLLSRQLLETNLAPEYYKNFQSYKELLSLEIISLTGMTAQGATKKENWTYADNGALQQKRNQFQNQLIERVKKDPTRPIIQNSSALYPSVSEENATPVATLIIPYSRLNDELDQVIIANIDLLPLQKIFSDNKLGTLILYNQYGNSIAGSEEKLLFNAKNISDSALYSFITNYPMDNYSGVSEQSKNSKMLSFVKTSQHNYLISEIPLETLLAPAELVALMTIKISGYFLAGSLFLLFLFSLNLIRPIERLAEISLEIAKGNFEHKPIDAYKRLFKDEVYTLSVAVEKMLKGLKEREHFRALFNKFHGSVVTEDLMRNEIALRGEKKNVFVFFSDLRGFTGMSETKDPTQVVEMLNEYFSHMVPIINQYGGVVDKFIGDAIMAVWGIPNEKPEDGKNALMACIKMRLALEQLNDIRQQRGEPVIWMGMGLHYGEAISGTIGSEERMEYTVIGNTINTASRIEASTKAFGTDLLISEEVQEQFGGFLFEEAGQVEVKGRSHSLKLFKVNGYISDSNAELEIKTPYSSFTPEEADKVKVVA